MPRSTPKTATKPPRYGRASTELKAAIVKELSTNDSAPAIAARLAAAGTPVHVNTVRNVRAALRNGKLNHLRQPAPPTDLDGVALSEAHGELHRVRAQRDRLAGLLIEVLTEEGSGWRLVKGGGGK